MEENKERLELLTALVLETARTVEALTKAVQINHEITKLVDARIDVLRKELGIDGLHSSNDN